MFGLFIFLFNHNLTFHQYSLHVCNRSGVKILVFMGESCLVGFVMSCGRENKDFLLFLQY